MTASTRDSEAKVRAHSTKTFRQGMLDVEHPAKTGSQKLYCESSVRPQIPQGMGESWNQEVLKGAFVAFNTLAGLTEHLEHKIFTRSKSNWAKHMKLPLMKKFVSESV